MTGEMRGRFTVLIVDDDPSVLRSYCKLLERAGYVTRAESDPSRLLADGPGDAPDLLLLDQRMPGITGLDLLAELRRRAWQARCVLVSASLDDDVRAEATRLGVDRVLGKPVDPASLRRTIDELLDGAARSTMT